VERALGKAEPVPSLVVLAVEAQTMVAIARQIAPQQNVAGRNGKGQEC